MLKKPETTLMAYQIGFDLYESATQQFLTSVRNSMKLVAAPPTTVADPAPAAEAMDTDEAPESNGSAATESAAATNGGTAAAATPEPSAELKKLAGILSGDTTISLHLQFLIRNNNTDLLVLRKTKETVSQTG